MDVSSMLSETASQATPRRKAPQGKSVEFLLLLDEGSKTRGRLNLRVKVNPHDTTESIISTVNRFYGIYDSGVSFEDASGDTLIAHYDNFQHDSTVYVRIVPAIQPLAQSSFGPTSSFAQHEPVRRPSLGEAFQMPLPPHLREHSHSPSRSSSRLRKRSTSPLGRGRRGALNQQKAGSFSTMSRGSSASSYRENDGYSEGEGGPGSVTSSRKAKSEQIVSSEISTLNVLQDGRRVQNLFDSSTLPLYQPPHVPVAASQASISPQRRVPQEDLSPFQAPVQRFYTMQQPPMLSPQSFGPTQSYVRQGSTGHQSLSTPATHGHHLRERTSSHQGRIGVLPTPSLTVASCVSDEEVVRVLVALGSGSHGRTSNSTMDETFSGVADAASSTGATSDSDDYSDEEVILPKHRRSVDDQEYDNNDFVKSEFEEPKTKKVKTKSFDGPSGSKSGSSTKSSKMGKSRTHTMPKTSKVAPQSGLSKTQNAPLSTAPARKMSSASSAGMPSQLQADEDDISTKPRCQRCRKSKKGCDRQRPCQRCKDAGIGIEGCISEDEGNGRKGRFGRYMGVAVKNGAQNGETEGQMLPPMAVAGGMGSPDKSKKRKR